MEKLPILRLAAIGFVIFVIAFIPTFIPSIGAGSMTLFSKVCMVLAALFMSPLVYAIGRSFFSYLTGLLK